MSEKNNKLELYVTQKTTYQGKGNPMYGVRNYGKNNPNYKSGNFCKSHYCIKCHKPISVCNFLYGSKLCRSCSAKNIKRTKQIRKYYCITCRKEIGYNSWHYGTQLCKSCSMKKAKKDSWKGKNNPKYIDNRTPKNHKIRTSSNYYQWRNKIFIKDNYICQNCGQYGEQLNAHHIEAFFVSPKLRFNINNGITLCEKCHKCFHNLYGKITNKYQLIKFLNNYEKL